MKLISLILYSSHISSCAEKILDHFLDIYSTFAVLPPVFATNIFSSVVLLSFKSGMNGWSSSTQL